MLFSSQGFGTEEEEEVSLRIEFFSKKSVSIINPTPILPALFTPNKRKVHKLWHDKNSGSIPRNACVDCET